MTNFVTMKAKKTHFFKQLLATLILGIFCLAITPWNALHHHDGHIDAHEKNCTHTVHVKVADDHCLICKAHFEKNYTSDFYNYIIHFKTELIKRIFPLIGSSFTEVIATCLRGPPSFS